MISKTMNNGRRRRLALVFAILTPCLAISVNNVTGNEASQDEVVGDVVLRAGDPTLARWTVPPLPRSKHKNPEAQANLGRILFFEKRLSAGNKRPGSTSSPACGITTARKKLASVS